MTTLSSKIPLFGRDIFCGACCMRKIDRLSVLCEKESITVVMGIGGSKTLDAEKAVARRQGVRVAVVPALASNDAPCSALSVICTPEGQFERSLFLSAILI